MNMLFALTPLIILLIIAVGVIYLVKKVPKSRKMKKYSYVKRTQWTFVIYLVVLALSVVVFFALPQDENTIFDKNHVKDEASSLYTTMDNGEVIDRKYIQDTWEFKTDKNNIELKTPSGNEIPIYVGIKGEHDQKITAAYYQTPAIIKGVDVTDRMNPLRVDLSSDKLIVTEPEQVELNFSVFQKEFTYRESAGEKWMDMDDEFTAGEQILYIQIPENIKLDHGPDTWIEYVSKRK